MKVLLIRQQHLAKLDRECVRRRRERNTIEYMRKVRKNRQAHRSNKRNNVKTFWKVVNRLI